MTRPLAFAALAFLPILQSASAADAPRPEWDDPAVIQVGTMPPRASFIPFPDRAAAIAGLDRQKDSSRLQSLSGTWAFHWSPSPAVRPVGFEDPAYPVASWGSIRVPGAWQTQGHDFPIYTNIIYPFDISEMRPPRAWNPVGSYRRDFQVTPEWIALAKQGGRILLHFEGVESAHYAWINGTRVGYSEGSREPAEYDVTALIREGRNVIAVEVYRWSDGSYLEDQDFWRMSGITRDVYLQLAPAARLEDLELLADFDPSTRAGRLDVTTFASAGSKVDLELLDPTGKAIALEWTSTGDATREVRSASLASVSPWSAERPTLYTLVVSTSGADGKVDEVVARRIGFRRVTIDDGVFLVNGAPVKLKGVNRHEHDPRTGRSVDRATMLRDIRLLKQFNFNAVRTAHYPNAPEWYDLCDLHGIYLIDEANMETHGFNVFTTNKINNDPRFTEMHVDRMRRMVERDLNHPSIVMWSIGNEAGDAMNTDAMYAWSKQRDSSRPTQYEGATSDKNRGEATDLTSRMYLPAKDMERLQGGWPHRPFILIEYTHAMGNSNGNLDAYWDRIWATPQFVGGFVWDWMDQGIELPIPHALPDPWGRSTFFAYGGWWENRLNLHTDGNFCFNGIIAADGTPRPGLKALKHVQRPVVAKLLEDGRVELLNRHDFTDLADELYLHWSVTTDAGTLAQGELALPSVAPYQRATLDLPDAARTTSADGRETWLDLSFRTRASSPFWERGHELAREQFKLGGAFAIPASTAAAGSVRLGEEAEQVVVEGDGWSIAFDRTKGTVASWTVDGIDLVQSGASPDFWRAPTDNDRGAGLADTGRGRLGPEKILTPSAVWERAARQWKPTLAPVERKDDGSVALSFSGPILNDGATIAIRYVVERTGRLRVDYSFEAKRKLAMIPRVGTEWVLPAGFSNLRWYGRGPEPTYTDRRWEPMGVFATTALGGFVDYSRPQENANRVDLRWMEVTDASGRGLRVMGEVPFSGALSAFSKEEMQEAEYSWQLDSPTANYLNVDLAQMGVGGDDSWGSTCLPEYRLTASSYQFSYVVDPIRP